MSKFCVMPWMHLTINADGRIRNCCNTHTKLDGVNFGYDRISDIWGITTTEGSLDKFIGET